MEFVKLKAKRTSHTKCILVDKVFPWGYELMIWKLLYLHTKTENSVKYGERWEPDFVLLKWGFRNNQE